MKYKNRLRFMSKEQKAAVQNIEESYSPIRKKVIRFLYQLLPNWFLWLLLGLLLISLPLHFPIMAIVVIGILFGLVICCLGSLSITQGWYFQSKGRIFITGYGAIILGIVFNIFGIWLIVQVIAKI